MTALPQSRSTHESVQPSLVRCRSRPAGDRLCLVGGLLGGRVQAEAQNSEDGLWTFGQVLALVEDQYIGEVDSKSWSRPRSTDCSTSWTRTATTSTPDSFSEMREEQRGKFHGLGIQITKRGPDKPLTIIAPIDDTPAWRAGLQSGDIISEDRG